MRTKKYFIVGNVDSYAEDTKTGTVLNAGQKIPFTLTDDFVTNNGMDEIIGTPLGLLVNDEKTTPLIPLTNLDSEVVLGLIYEINRGHHDVHPPGHKHGVIKSVSAAKVEVEITNSTGGNEIIELIPGNVKRYEELSGLNEGTEIHYWLENGGSVNWEEEKH